MLAAFVSTPAPKDPLSVLEVGERPEPEVPDGWTTVQVEAVSLNHHDLFSLRGVGLPQERMPMILGTDAAGLDEDGNEVVVHGVVATPGWTGDETLDPKRSLFSELHQGTMAERVAVPRRNVLPKPAELSFAEAACLPTAWTTTSLPSSSSPAASHPRIIGSASSRSPTPRSDQRSWWLSEVALTVTVVQPSGTSGSGRSPVVSPESGSSEENEVA